MHDRHLFRVQNLSALARESLDLSRAADGTESAALDRERFRSRHAIVYCVNLRVDDNEIRVAALDRRRDLHYSHSGKSRSSQAHEFSTTAMVLPHVRSLENAG